MVNSRGQLKIQQMTFMLIAVTLFFALAGLFVFVILYSGIHSQAQELQQENAVLLVSKLANSPEFSCGNAFGTSRLNCIDEDKVFALSQNMKKYSNFWGVQAIKIIKIYPSGNSNVGCTSANYPNCGKIVLLAGQGVGVSNFVTLCRKEQIQGSFVNKCDLAELVVSYNGG